MYRNPVAMASAGRSHVRAVRWRRSAMSAAASAAQTGSTTHTRGDRPVQPVRMGPVRSHIATLIRGSKREMSRAMIVRHGYDTEITPCATDPSTRFLYFFGELMLPDCLCGKMLSILTACIHRYLKGHEHP